MQNFDLYVGLKRKRAEYGDQIDKTKKEISRLELEGEDLRREFLQAEALEDHRGAESLQRKVKANEEAIVAGRTIVEKVERAAAAADRERDRVRPVVLQEIKREYRPRYERALKDFLKKLREAGDAELEALKVAAEAVRIAGQADISEMCQPVPPIDHVIVDCPDGSLIDRFVKDCKNQGMEID
ncbi:MAG: hypothetical protein Q8O91_05645 [Candidatus Aminicenantes bacterium]|nr:hypothetical protein [Candidatus Aminicenantes bacterium]